MGGVTKGTFVHVHIVLGGPDQRVTYYQCWLPLSGTTGFFAPCGGTTLHVLVFVAQIISTFQYFPRVRLILLEQIASPLDFQIPN